MRGADPAEPTLLLEGVERSYPLALGLRRRRVLRGVDLRLERGAGLGLVGPNGSGKSTLLRLIAGVDRPDRGRVRALGGSPADAAVRARVGFLPEDSPFPRELRARAALQLCAELRGVPRPRERARAWLARVGLEQEERTPLGRFSRGMLRRFGLAQAFLHEPRLILLDEPTAGLDAPGHGVFEELLEEAGGRGASVVVCSHHLADVVARCDVLALLIDGRMLAVGPPAEVLGPGGPRGIELEGLDARALEQLRELAESAGGHWIGEGPSARALLDVYRRASGRGEPGER